ncbi:MAG TPA: hypothetical protein VF766_07605 [Pyrinomonadaceae bacterium]
MRYPKALLLLLPIVALLIYPAHNQAQQDSADASSGVVTGSLWELRNSRNILLMVRRSNVVDSRGLAKTILNEVYRTSPETTVRYPRLFNMLARKLNNYMKKYQSISAVKDISDADFIVLFNLLEYRRPLGFYYPYGEMFVILNKTSDGKPPRIVWKTRKSSVWAEDAIEDFIKELKAVRGES